MQLRHAQDDDWVSISYQTAKAEQDRGNKRRVRKSHLFKDGPVEPGSRTVDNRGGGFSGGQGSANITGDGLGIGGNANNRYKPVERATEPTTSTGTSGTSTWRPPSKSSMDFE